MTVTMSKELQRKLTAIRRREWWPVASLADMLGRPKVFIYRRVDACDFEVVDDGTGFMKVTTASVVAYFEERYEKYG